MFKIPSKLKKDIRNNDFIVIGETHGIKENLDIIKYFINFLTDQNIPIILGIEWPSDLNMEINDYVKKNKSDLNWKRWVFSSSPDGRISKEHLKFLGWLKKKQIPIKCFDSNGKSWNDRDKKMAKNITDVFNKNKDHKIIALMGNLHAKKHSFVLSGKVCRPLVSYLPKDKTISFKISYLSGRYFNMFVKKIELDKEIKLENKKAKIIKLKNGVYDYEIFLKKATPVNILRKNEY